MEESREFVAWRWIKDDYEAEKALKKRAEKRSEKEKWQAFYDGHNEKVQAQLDGEITELESCLRGYFESVPHRETKTQETYILPSGKLVYRKPGVSYERDETQLVEWAKIKCPEFVRTTETPMWCEIKEYMKKTGEIPPGVTAVEQPGKFEVSI